MIKRSKSILSLLPAALVILSAAVFTPGQSSTKTNQRPTAAPSAPVPSNTEALAAVDDGTRYSYEFKQPEFYLSHITIEHDSLGRGKIKFSRKNEEVAVEEKLQVSPTALARILGLYETLQFLDSQTKYQSEKQFPHMGTMWIRMERGGRKREVEFNWSSNEDAAALANEYRRIADQAVFVFDMSVARANQPLNAPKLLEGLESLLKRDSISDPQQLVPLLKEISTDEHLPLIARNHAIRLLKKIEKGK